MDDEFWPEDVLARAKGARPTLDIEENGLADDPSADIHIEGTVDLTASQRSQIVFDLMEAADMSQLPYSACGKLFFEKPSHPGVVYCGTACYVAPKVLLTAAHCVMDKTEVYEKMLFIQQYAGGSSGYRKRVMLNSFVFNCDYKRIKSHLTLDYAFLLMEDASEGGVFVPIALDKLLVKSDLPADDIENVGYPLDQHKGSVMMVSKGRAEESLCFSECFLRMPSCPLSTGASGGPMLRKIGCQWQVIGVHSHGKNPQGKNYSPQLHSGIFSPCFDLATCSFYITACRMSGMEDLN